MTQAVPEWVNLSHRNGIRLPSVGADELAGQARLPLDAGNRAAHDAQPLLPVDQESPSMPEPGYPIQDITGLVLAGGLARRMGGIDKGLVQVGGKPMVEHALAALRPQVGRLLINANRNLDTYARYGVPVVADTIEGFQGPLAGIFSGLAETTTPYLLSVPCDSPLLAPDLAACMFRALEEERADLAVAHDGRRQQPVFLLLRRELAPDLQAYLAGGDRKIDLWFARHKVAEADLSHRPDNFVNVNDEDEHRRLEARLASGQAAG
jgi:molybdenum cofactor guanylyltransferase